MFVFSYVWVFFLGLFHRNSCNKDLVFSWCSDVAGCLGWTLSLLSLFPGFWSLKLPVAPVGHLPRRPPLSRSVSGTKGSALSAPYSQADTCCPPCHLADLLALLSVEAFLFTLGKQTAC